MQRRGRSVEPVLLAGGAPQDSGHQFEVTVDYLKIDGVAAVYRGRFYAANAMLAEATGRDFVIRYLRPQSVGDVATVPI